MNSEGRKSLQVRAEIEKFRATLKRDYTSFKNSRNRNNSSVNYDLDSDSERD